VWSTTWAIALFAIALMSLTNILATVGLHVCFVLLAATECCDVHDGKLKFTKFQGSELNNGD
jgi:hypothetical protein